MMERHPAFSTLFDLEEAVADIERYGDLLMDLGCGDVELTRGGVYVTGKQLKLLGKNVERQWKLAIDQTRSDR